MSDNWSDEHPYASITIGTICIGAVIALLLFIIIYIIAPTTGWKPDYNSIFMWYGIIVGIIYVTIMGITFKKSYYDSYNIQDEV